MVNSTFAHCGCPLPVAIIRLPCMCGCNDAAGYDCNVAAPSDCYVWLLCACCCNVGAVDTVVM